MNGCWDAGLGLIVAWLLSQARRITSFSPEPRMLCGTERRQWRSVKATPPSLHPSILGWSCFWPWPPSLYRTHAAAESVMPAAAFPLPPAAAPPASGPACSGLRFQYQLGRERPRPWSTDRGHLAGYNFGEIRNLAGEAAAPRSGPRRMLCTYQRGVQGVDWHLEFVRNALQ